jgi:uncharacterized damage-inducible protein DinB
MVLEHLRRMARHNHGANRRLHAACRDLPEAEHGKPRQAFFRSLHGTLNHILTGDRLCLARIELQGRRHSRSTSSIFSDKPSKPP